MWVSERFTSQPLGALQTLSAVASITIKVFITINAGYLFKFIELLKLEFTSSIIHSINIPVYVYVCVVFTLYIYKILSGNYFCTDIMDKSFYYQIQFNSWCGNYYNKPLIFAV